MPVDRKKPSRSRIDREKRTVEYMVGLYCRKKEGYPIPCAECAALIRYAHDRLDRCAFGEAKTSCRRCPIHCYRPAMREKMMTRACVSRGRACCFTLPGGRSLTGSGRYSDDDCLSWAGRQTVIRPPPFISRIRARTPKIAAHTESGSSRIPVPATNFRHVATACVSVQ